MSSTPDHLAMAAQIAGNAARVAWFYGAGRLLARATASASVGSSSIAPGVSPAGSRPPGAAKKPVPTMRELLADVGALMLQDAAGARDGLYPPAADEADGIAAHLGRLRAMLADAPEAFRRRAHADAASVKALGETEGLPSYYAQDFHFQTGGYLTEASARLYDVQVETLFMGTANAMRRAALRPIAEHVRGRDQRRLALLDVACGTGRLLRQVRLAFPAMRLSGIDLSAAYLAEARRHLGRLRPAALTVANAEALPAADASQDVVTCVFLFHELPGDVRRRVAAEMARVLKPGGLLVFIDSLQLGDRPGWDGLLEAFPVRFHEPYFRGYAIDDLDGLLAAAGLARVETRHAFLSKVMVRRKTG